MPFIHRLGKRVGDASAHANQRRLVDTKLGRYLVGGAEADDPDVAGQTVGVFRDQPNGIAAVGLVDAHRR
jgi:hypothetical protein